MIALASLVARSPPFRTTFAGVVPSGPPVPKTFSTRPLPASDSDPRFSAVPTSPISGNGVVLENWAPLWTFNTALVALIVDASASSKGPVICTVAAVAGVPDASAERSSSTLPRWIRWAIGSKPPRLISDLTARISPSVAVPVLATVERTTRSNEKRALRLLLSMKSSGPFSAIDAAAVMDAGSALRSVALTKLPPDSSAGPALNVELLVNCRSGDVVVLTSFAPSLTKKPSQHAAAGTSN